MSEPSFEDLKRENVYLKQRVAQLESQVTDLTAELTRAGQMLDRIFSRSQAKPPNPYRND